MTIANPFIRACRDGWMSKTLSVFMLWVVALCLVSMAVPAQAAVPTIDSIVIKFREGALEDPAGGLNDDEQAALFDEIQTPFSQVGYTRDGALRLQLSNALPLDAARAAVNRVRLLPQVLYANLGETTLVAGSVAPAHGAAAAQRAAAQQPRIARLIVKYRDGPTSAAAARNEALPPAALSRLASHVGQPVAHERAMSGGAYVVRLLQAVPLDQAQAIASYIESDPSIEYAVPDLMKQPALVPNDPSYASQWHYMSPPAEPGGVNLPPAWNITTGSTGIVVAVIDTGSLPSHPDLAGRFVGGYDFIHDGQIGNDGNGRDADPTDVGDWITAAESASGYFAGCVQRVSSWHGSHVAGTIGAATNNGTGVAGINWVSKILPVRVLGKCGGYTSDIVDAIRWSAGLSVPSAPANSFPARVMNLSLSGYSCDSNGQNCGCDAPTQSAINDVVAASSVVVVAAGNAATEAIQYAPGNCNGVITVGATGRQGERASYSNYGSLLEISAPGGGSSGFVLSTLNTGTTTVNPGGYTYVGYQGTSMATPHVAGIASLMLSVNPALTPAQITSKIQTSARAFPPSGGCNTALCGAGIIDAAAAVISAGGGAQSPSTTVLGSSGSPALVGSSVTFTATVTGNNPTGSVTFTEGGNAICAAGTLSGNPRTASCSTSALSVGVHSIVANYAGDANNAASSSTPLSQVITGVAGGFTNGGFEVPNLGGGFQYAPAGATWVFTGGAGISGNGSGFTSGNPPAPEGVQVAFLQSSGSQVAQSATIAAGTYTLSLHAAQRGNYQSGTQVLQVLVDGVPVGQFQPPSTAYTNYQTPAFTIATTGSHTLSVASIGTGADFTGFVDDVRLTATGGTPVDQTISFGALADRTLAASPFTVSATASSGLPVSFSSLTPPVCTVSGTTVTLVATGLCTIRAAQAGNAAFNPAPNVDRSFTVSPGVAGGFTNGGFEVPNVGGGFQYAPAGATWVFTGGAGISGNGSGFTSGNPPAPEGVQVAFLQDSGSQVAQSATIAAGTYTLSLRAAQRGNYQSGTQVLQVLVDGVPVGQFQPPSTAYTNYQTPAFTIATTGSHTLSVASIGSGAEFTGFVDDVRLTSTVAGGFTNGGFEVPNVGGGFQYAPAGATWVFTGGAGISGNGSGFTSGNPPAPEGVQVAFLQSSGSQVAQSATIAAGTYTLSLRAAQRGNYQSGTQVLQVLVDGVPVGQFQPPSTAYTNYQTPAFTIATTGSHTLSVASIGTGADFTGFVDDVRLTSQ